jgi:hypothetical protein
MKLESVSLHDVRTVGTVDIDLSPALASNAPFFVTGPAGSGKTTVLEAIAAAKEAAAPYGLPPKRSSFRDSGRPDGRVVLRWRLSATAPRAGGATADVVTTTWSLAEAAPSDLVRAPALRSALGDYTRDDARFKVEYYHAGRSFDPADELAELSRGGGDGAKRLTRDARKYAWIRRYLIGLGADDAAAVREEVAGAGVVFASARAVPDAPFGAKLAALTSKLRWVGIRRRQGEWACMFAVKHRGEVELSALSDSERMFVLFAASLDALGLARALVLVDLPELALHPEDHLSFVSGLAAAIPAAQIIAATTSPAILRSVPPGRVLVLDGPRT